MGLVGLDQGFGLEVLCCHSLGMWLFGLGNSAFGDRLNGLGVCSRGEVWVCGWVWGYVVLAWVQGDC